MQDLQYLLIRQVRQTGQQQQYKCLMEKQKHSYLQLWGKDLAASGILGQKENKVDYTNTYKDIAVTGIIVNNFPFIIMIGMAIVAFAGIVVMNSKKRMNRR